MKLQRKNLNIGSGGVSKLDPEQNELVPHVQIPTLSSHSSATLTAFESLLTSDLYRPGLGSRSLFSLRLGSQLEFA